MHFIECLHGVAQVPTTSDIIQDTAYDLSGLPTPEAFNMACRLLSAQLKFDISIVRCEHELLSTLATNFHPILLPREASLVPTHSWDIAKEVTSMGSGEGHAFLPAMRPKHDSSTHAISMDDVRRTMLYDTGPSPMNMLDVRNRSSHVFSPAAIAEVDLIVLIKSRYDEGTWTRSDDPQIMSYDWMLLTAGPVASPFHADQAGYCTAVNGLQGEKWWYFPNGDWEMSRKAFYLSGTTFVNYPNGVSVVVIGEGDCFIQGPGTPHAVVTQGKSLAAGCFIYTAAFFARSIQYVRLYFEERLDDNEAISVRDYANLSLVVNHLDRDIFKPAQRAAVFVKVGFLLLSQERIARDGCGQMKRVDQDLSARAPKRGKGTKRTAHQGTSLASGDDTATAKDRFVESCLTWWLREQSRFPS